MQGKLAIVTGGASGLGQGTVEAFVAKGARVAIFDLNEARAAEIMGALGDDKVFFWKVNVADEDAVRKAVQEVTENHGEIHVLNNFAGIGTACKTVNRGGPFPMDQWQPVLDVNLTGTFNVARYVAAQMAKNEPVTKDGGRGVIIHTASVAAYEGQVGQLAYSASKGGVVAMTLPMARDLGSLGIRVNTIVPGLIYTPLVEAMMTEQVHESLHDSLVFPKRQGSPEEIAHLAVFMVENDYLNGECIRLDAAIRMKPR